MRPAILYLHGFNSSPKSQKAGELTQWLPDFNPDIDLLVPQLGFDPDLAFLRASEALASLNARPVGIIGSSLGGFYATALSQRYGVRAALINPAVRPYILLRDHLGAQHNPYTDERYTLTCDHMTALRRLEPSSIERPELLFLLQQTGDETLDYRDAAQYYRGSPSWFQPGGDHRFQRFDRVVPAILGFFGMARA